MATEKKRVIKLDTKQASKSVKELRDELKELKDTLLSTEKGTSEYNEAMAQAAEIQHTLKEQMEEVNASAMDTGQIIGNAAKTFAGFTGTIQAVQGALNLMGIESEGVTEAIKTMQSIMAITSGLTAIDNGIKSFKRLGLVIKNSEVVMKLFGNTTKATSAAEQAQSAATKGLAGSMVATTASTTAASVAMKVFRTALISTGIGAIVVAIGLLIANMDKLVNLVNKAARDTKKAKEEFGGLNRQYADGQRQISKLAASVNVYERRLKSVQDLNELLMQQLKARGASAEEIHKQQEENDKAELQAKNDLIAAIDREIQSVIELGKKYSVTMKDTVEGLEKAIRTVGDLTGAIGQQELAVQQLNDGLIDEFVIYGKHGEKVATYTKKTVEQLQIRIDKEKQQLNLLNQFIALKTKEEEINNGVAASAAAQAAANRQYAKERAQQIQNNIFMLQELDARNQIGIEQRLTQLNISLEKEKAAWKRNYEDRIVTAEQYNKAIKDIEDYYSRERSKALYDDFVKKQSTAYKQTLEQIKQLHTHWTADMQLNTKALLQGYINVEMDLEDTLHRVGLKEILAEGNLMDLFRYGNNALESRAMLWELDRQKMDLAFATAEENYKVSVANITAEKNQVLKALEEYDKAVEENRKKGIEPPDFLTEDDIAQMKLRVDELNRELGERELAYANEYNQLVLDSRQQMYEQEKILFDEQMAYMDESMQLYRDAWVGLWADSGVLQPIGDGVSNLIGQFYELGKTIADGKATWMDYANFAAACFNQIGSTLSQLASQQDDQTKEGFEQQKKLQISAAVMNLMGGLVSAWASAMNPANAWMTVWGQIAMGAVMSAMLAATAGIQIQNIAKRKFSTDSGTGSASSSAGAALAGPSQVQYANVIDGGAMEESVIGQKVYVVENEITQTQTDVRVAEREAGF